MNQKKKNTQNLKSAEGRKAQKIREEINKIEIQKKLEKKNQ